MQPVKLSPKKSKISFQECIAKLMKTALKLSLARVTGVKDRRKTRLVSQQMI